MIYKTTCRTIISRSLGLRRGRLAKRDEKPLRKTTRAEKLEQAYSTLGLLIERAKKYPELKVKIFPVAKSLLELADKIEKQGLMTNEVDEFIELFLAKLSGLENIPLAAEDAAEEIFQTFSLFEKAFEKGLLSEADKEELVTFVEEFSGPERDEEQLLFKIVEQDPAARREIFEILDDKN